MHLALYTIRIREYEYGEGSLDEVLSHFTPALDRPFQSSADDERDMAY